MTNTSEQTPADALPDKEDEPIDRAMLIKAYALNDPPTDAWINRGDQGNTAMHGGRWITYDPDRTSWEIVNTEHIQVVYGGDNPFAYDDPGEQYVRSGNIDFSDVVTEDGEWTDEAESFKEGMHRSHNTPAGAIVDHDFTDFVVNFATSRNSRIEPVNQHIPDSIDINEPGIVVRDDYESVLEYMGVTPTGEK